MIVTTSPSIEGETVTAYLGIVAGEATHAADAGVGMDRARMLPGRADAIPTVPASGPAVRCTCARGR
jgi:uncharacterized protein YbjQ (UPF0145 family)